VRRSGKELLIATRAFNEKSRSRSWWYLGTTIFLLVASLFVAALAPWWLVRLVGSILGGLTMARAFILYHDFMHGSILKGSRPAKVLMYAVGLLMLVPPRSWRDSHNSHHANVAKLGIPAVGSYPILTTAEWRKASRAQRFLYRLSRHPLTILSAYLSIFALTITIAPLLEHPRKNWDSAVALLVHGGVLAGLWLIGGPALTFFVLLLPFAIASALGAYLFYAQHTFPGIKMLRADEWTYYRAALESAVT
jgi:acyl-lipid omega-6 desaturase (Delta-12 desaturase)